VWIARPPPILQIQLQRVQFNRETADIYKSNSYLKLERSIYLDRYLLENEEKLWQIHNQVHSWRTEFDKLQEVKRKLSPSSVSILQSQLFDTYTT
jgi:hypothetical protein